MMNIIKITLLLTTLFFITACGYHLRGNLDLPDALKQIYITGASTQLRDMLKKTLRSSDVTLATNASDAGIVIQVEKEKMRRHVVSLNSSGRSNEYELYYVLNFLLLDSDGKPLSDVQLIEITRDYFNDQEELLAKNNEEKMIKDEIYRQAIISMINRSRIALQKMTQQIN
ncbi:MAG: hypothetical protein HFP77_08290 [Methylococcales symbiont of Iophon sp. n. MRB-2018]|nr:MAG: hypothetical protein HFP77_08290 [Methylococcales symbiont of Iophon sp. n. MRB-2018]KAF3980070.1 MAG: hypothetical protein HFP76_04055 [Methylococcales symbiont of Iophon sp. n. MRB-2018]